MARVKRALKKAIAVIGEGYTERDYFNYIRVTRQFKFSFKPELCKPSNYKEIFNKAKQLKQEDYDLIFCVLDIDTIIRENHLADFAKRCKQLGSKNIIPIASNPCIEFWFLLHFQKHTSFKFYEDCNQLMEQLQKYIPNYNKNHKSQ
ncbi:MAG: RloB family protein, partial [Sphaerochaetaceae bacterium]